MTKLKLRDIHAMSLDEVHHQLTELKKEQIKLTAQIAIGTMPKNPHQVKNTKKTIARLLTDINRRENTKKLVNIKSKNKVQNKIDSKENIKNKNQTKND